MGKVCYDEAKYPHQEARDVFQLTMDAQTSAQLLGIAPESFQDFEEREQLEGIIKLPEGWRDSTTI